MLKRIKNAKAGGASELMSFLLLIPILIAVFVLMIYIMQMTLTAQALSYATYCATRAAVVSETEEQAIENANAVARQCLPSGYMNLDEANWSYTTEDGEENVWTKGKIIRGTVTLRTRVFVPFGGHGYKEMQASVVCMVERPAT